MTDKLTKLKRKNAEIKARQKVVQTTELYVKEVGKTLIYCRSWGRFLYYNDKYFELLQTHRLQKMLWDFLKDFDIKFDITPAFLSSVIDAIKINTEYNISDHELAHNYFAFNDTLLNTDTFKCEDFSLDIPCFKYIDIDLKSTPNKPMPVFDKYIESSLVYEEDNMSPDQGLIDLYQEMWGMLFSAHRDASKVFFLKGTGDNGKSITTELMIRALGEQYVSASSLQKLTSDNFGRQALVGKILNVCSEEESTKIKNDAFKALVTGELITAERKFENAFDFHPRAKFVFATNDAPNFMNLEYAMKKRMTIIPWYAQFPKGDPQRVDGLLEKLIKELPQIVVWALKGLKRLQQNHFIFTESESTQYEMRELMTASTSARPYIYENYDILTKDEIKNDTEPLNISTDIYPNYKNWCISNGFQAMSVITLGKRITQIEGMRKAKRKNNTYYYLRPKETRVNMNENEVIPSEEFQDANTQIPF